MINIPMIGYVTCVTDNAIVVVDEDNRFPLYAKPDILARAKEMLSYGMKVMCNLVYRFDDFENESIMVMFDPECPESGPLMGTTFTKDDIIDPVPMDEVEF